MNKESIKNYLIVGFLYLFQVALLTLYAEARKGTANGFLLSYLEYAIGHSGFILAGFFIFSKTLKRISDKINSRGELIEVVGKIGLASCLTFGIIFIFFLNDQISIYFQSYLWLFGLASITLIIVFLLIVGFSEKLIKDRPATSASNIKYWTMFGMLTFFLFVTVVDKLGNWVAWLQYILGSAGSANNSVFPPPSLIVAIYMLTTILIYIWETISQPDIPPTNEPAAAIQPPVTSQIQNPIPPPSPPPQTPQPPSLPQNPPVNTQTG